MNFYKHHIGDYDSHTQHLSWSQDCAYRRLISAYYLRERPLPADLQLIFRMAKATRREEKAAVTQVLLWFFTQSDSGEYHNTRADKEINQYQAQCEANRNTSRKRIELKSILESKTNRSPNQNQIPEPKPERTNTSTDEPTRAELAQDPFDEIESQNPDDYPDIPAKPKVEKTKPREKWWIDHDSIDREGRKYGVVARSGEDYPSFKDRIFQEINRRRNLDNGKPSA